MMNMRQWRGEDRGRCNEWGDTGQGRSGSVLLQSWSKSGTKSVKSSGDVRHGLTKWRGRMMGRRMSAGEFVDGVF